MMGLVKGLCAEVVKMKGEGKLKVKGNVREREGKMKVNVWKGIHSKGTPRQQHSTQILAHREHSERVL